jgi:hypothetical protein
LRVTSEQASECSNTHVISIEHLISIEHVISIHECL